MFGNNSRLLVVDEIDKEVEQQPNALAILSNILNLVKTMPVRGNQEIIRKNIFILSQISPDLTIDKSLTDLKRNDNEDARAYLARLNKIIENIKTENKNIAELISQVSDLKNNHLKTLQAIPSIRIDEPEILDKNLKNIIHKLETLKEKLIEVHEEAIKTFNQFLSDEIKPKPKTNTITLRIWYRRKPEERMTILGQPSDGHISLDICLSDGKRKYVSLIAQTDMLIKPAGAVSAKVTNALHLPSTGTHAGIFVSPEEDIAKLLLPNKKRLTSQDGLPNEESEYTYYEKKEVVYEFSSDDEYALDIAAAYEWAEEILKNHNSYENVTINPDGTRSYSQQYYNYNFWNANCTVAGDGLVLASQKYRTQYEKPFLGFGIPEQMYLYAGKLQTELGELNFNNKLKGKPPTEEEWLANALQMIYANINAVILNYDIHHKENKSESDDPLISFLRDNNNQLKKLLALEESENPFLSEMKDVQTLRREIFNSLNEMVAEIGREFPESEYVDLIRIIFGSVIRAFPEWAEIEKRVLQENKIFEASTQVSRTPQEKNYQSSLNLIKDIHALKQEKISLAIEYSKVKTADQKTGMKKKFTELNEKIRQKQSDLGLLNTSLYFNPDNFDPNNEAAILTESMEKQFVGLSANGQKDQKDIIGFNNPTNAENVTTIKPSRFNISKWNERHLAFVEDTKGEIKQILKENHSPHEKLFAIQTLIADRKPAAWKIWRREERKRYEMIECQAHFISIADDFIKGRTHIYEFIAGLENFSANYLSDKSYHLIRNKIEKTIIDLTTTARLQKEEYTGEKPGEKAYTDEELTNQKNKELGKIFLGSHLNISSFLRAHFNISQDQLGQSLNSPKLKKIEELLGPYQEPPSNAAENKKTDSKTSQVKNKDVVNYHPNAVNDPLAVERFTKGFTRARK